MNGVCNLPWERVHTETGRARQRSSVGAARCVPPPRQPVTSQCQPRSCICTYCPSRRRTCCWEHMSWRMVCPRRSGVLKMERTYDVIVLGVPLSLYTTVRDAPDSLQTNILIQFALQICARPRVSVLILKVRAIPGILNNTCFFQYVNSQINWRSHRVPHMQAPACRREKLYMY